MKKSKPKRLNKTGADKLSPAPSDIESLKIPNPAKRALLNSGIQTVADLSKRTMEEVKKFHGIGPSAFPVLKQALRRKGLTFKKPE
jgi:DNA-directed RNA polymerase alpha subunit